MGLLVDSLLPIDPGSYSWLGQEATLTKSFLVSAEAGSYAWSGSPADLDLGMPAGSASYAWTGQDATLSVTSGATIVADSGSFAWAGSQVDFYTDHVTQADAGSFSWTVQDVTLQSAAVEEPGFIGSRTIDTSTDDWFIDMVYDEELENKSKPEIL